MRAIGYTPITFKSQESINRNEQQLNNKNSTDQLITRLSNRGTDILITGCNNRVKMTLPNILIEHLYNKKNNKKDDKVLTKALEIAKKSFYISSVIFSTLFCGIFFKKHYKNTTELGKYLPLGILLGVLFGGIGCAGIALKWFANSLTFKKLCKEISKEICEEEDNSLNNNKK